MPAKNLILDLDNTVYDYDSPHQLALSMVVAHFSSKFNLSTKQTQQSFDRARQNTQLELPGSAASHNRLLYFQKMLEYNGLNSMSHALELYELYWNTFLVNMTLFEGVIDFLDNFRQNQGKVCILTDLTAHIQHRKIQKLGLAVYTDYIVSSEEVGVEKPHPYMFARALQKLESDPSEALMIGDNWAKDIIGANALGIHSIWINHKNERNSLPDNVREVAGFNDIMQLSV